MDIEKNEVRYKEYFMDDAEIVIVAFGTAGRVASTAVRAARQAGIKVGLFRPITLMPFPDKRLGEIAQTAKTILVVEMNTGMMLDDVKLAVNGRIPIEFYGRLGGVTPFPEEIMEEVQRIAENPPAMSNGNVRADWLTRLENKLAGGQS
jgi:2-oxoglutarate ferredoxin oxidoreductase subunit alpha